MIDHQFCSKSQIRVGGREFNSVEELIESSRIKDDKELPGKRCLVWWDDKTIMFPDKEFCSASMVEVAKKRVTVGYPAYYFSYDFSTIKKALEFADKVNKLWLDFDGNWRDFLDQEIWSSN